MSCLSSCRSVTVPPPKMLPGAGQRRQRPHAATRPPRTVVPQQLLPRGDAPQRDQHRQCQTARHRRQAAVLRVPQGVAGLQAAGAGQQQLHVCKAWAWAARMPPPAAAACVAQAEAGLQSSSCTWLHAWHGQHPPVHHHPQQLQCCMYAAWCAWRLSRG